MTPPARRHTDVLLETTAFAGRRMLEIGCGDGRLLSWAATQGADAVGLDPQHGQLARARQNAPGLPLVAGRGERLPFASGYFDLLLCFNSLHHVPLDAQWQALVEASRVLATGGEFVVVEPLAEGEHFALLRPVDDETEVRREAFRALHAAAAVGLRMTLETFYSNLVVEASVVALRQRFLAIDASRATALDQARDEVEHLFETLGTPVDCGRAFIQPMRLNRLQRQ